MKEIKLNRLKETIYYDKCSNGLEIYMWVNEKVNNYYATLNVKYGSIDTEFKIKDKKYNVSNGIAHFLEHINFNEDDKTNASNYFDLKGTYDNAFTSYNLTCYEVFGSNDLLGDINHLLDFVQKKYITNEIVDKERGIILEEIKMKKNNPNVKMYYEINKGLFNKNKRKIPVIGYDEDIKKISKKELDLVYDTFYQPQNMFIIVTGNFNPYEVAASIKENQKNKKNKLKKEDIKIIYEKEDSKLSKNCIEIKGNIEIPKLTICYKMPRKIFKKYNDFYLRIYLMTILNANFGATSNLKEDLMEKERINTLGYSVNVYDDNVVISISSETKYPEELTLIIKENIKKLSITPDRLKRKIKCSLAHIITGFDDIDYINSYIQTEVILYNKVINNVYNIYKDLSIDDINDIIKLLDFSNDLTVVMNPEKNTNN